MAFQDIVKWNGLQVVTFFLVIIRYGASLGVVFVQILCQSWGFYRSQVFGIVQRFVYFQTFAWNFWFRVVQPLNVLFFALFFFPLFHELWISLLLNYISVKLKVDKLDQIEKDSINKITKLTKKNLDSQANILLV